MMMMMSENNTPPPPKRRERKKERKKNFFSPQKKRTMRSLEASSLVARVSPLVFFYGVLSRPFINNIKKEKERQKATFLGFQKRHSESTDSRVPISDLLLSSSRCFEGLYLLETTLHTREGPSSFWTSYVILSKTFVQKNAGVRVVVSRHRRFDDDVGPPSPRWWWWWWWVRSKTTKRVHHSKVFLERGNHPD